MQKSNVQKKDGSDRSLDQKATGYNELLLPPGTPSAEIVPELKPLDDEIVVTKTTDSVLAGTSLRLWLNNMGIDAVVNGVLLLINVYLELYAVLPMKVLRYG